MQEPPLTIGSSTPLSAPSIHPIYSENVIIRRVHVLTEGPNNDGIDPDSCRNVLVEHCVFDTGDDVAYTVFCTGYGSGLSASYLVTDSPLQPGRYRFTAKTGLQDRAGNGLTQGVISVISQS